MSGDTYRTWRYFRAENGWCKAAYLTLRLRWQGCAIPGWWLP